MKIARQYLRYAKRVPTLFRGAEIKDPIFSRQAFTRRQIQGARFYKLIHHLTRNRFAKETWGTWHRWNQHFDLLSK